jgi:alpha-tubulin suppressor-like RCC1 family protein
VFAKTGDGNFYSWGYNSAGQAGHPSKSLHTPTKVPLQKEISEVICGGYHTLGLDSDGGLWGWGRNDKGNLGTGDVDNSAAPRKISGIPDPVVAACAGLFHSLVLTSVGEVYAWDGIINTKSEFGISVMMIVLKLRN